VSRASGRRRARRSRGHGRTPHDCERSESNLLVFSTRIRAMLDCGRLSNMGSSESGAKRVCSSSVFCLLS
jgi:hypothetical protein